MFGLFAAGALAVLGVALLGLLGAVIALVCWVFVLPFKLLGLAFRGIAFVLALPFLLVAAILGVAIFGVGALIFAFPALPFLGIVAAIWWLMKRRHAGPHIA